MKCEWRTSDSVSSFSSPLSVVEWASSTAWGHCVCRRCTVSVNKLPTAVRSTRPRPNLVGPSLLTRASKEGYWYRRGCLGMGAGIWWVATPTPPDVVSTTPRLLIVQQAAHLHYPSQNRFHAQRCRAGKLNSGPGRNLCGGVIPQRCVSAWSGASPDRGCRTHEGGLLPLPLSGVRRVGFGCIAIQRLFLFSGAWQGRWELKLLFGVCYRMYSQDTHSRGHCYLSGGGEEKCSKIGRASCRERV